MFSTLPFELHPLEYDQWFDQYKPVFESEIESIRPLLPKGRGTEIGLGTGRFSQALGIKEGVEPSNELRKIAVGRGIDVKDAIAEKLPYANSSYDFVLMVSCVSYFTDISMAFMEARRILKTHGSLIVAFIDKNSPIGRLYEKKKSERKDFYKLATFYTPETIKRELKSAGFGSFYTVQTLFNGLEIETAELPLPGTGNGSFVVIKAIKEK